MKVGGQCVTDATQGQGQGLLTGLTDLLGGLFGGKTQPGTPGTPGQPGQMPAGGLDQIIAGIGGALTGIFGGLSESKGCAPGLTYNPLNGQCVGPGGVSVPPGFTNPNTQQPPAGGAASPWGTWGPVIAGVLGIGVIATVGYFGYKAISQPKFPMPMEDDSMSELDDFLAGLSMAESAVSDMEGIGDEMFDLDEPYPAYAANRRRRRRRRKSRRGRGRSWRSRRRSTRRRRGWGRRGRRRRRWSRR